MGIWIELLLVLLLIIGNGLLAMSETAIVSASNARLEQRAGQGSTGATLALRLTERPNVFLATVQIGISLIGVLSGAFGGATLAGSVAPLLGRIGPLAPYADQVALLLVVLLITYLSLIIGELVPKRLALNDPEAIAARVAGPMTRLARLGAPLVHVLGVSTDVVLRVLRVRQQEEAPVSAAEIGFLLEQGARAGVFKAAQRDMVEAVFDLSGDSVAGLMTPRRSVVWLDLTEPVDDQIARLLGASHNTLPVARESLDHVVGTVRTKHLLPGLLRGEPLAIEPAVEPALYVPESLSVLQLLDRFRREHQQVALVVDEFGGVAGLISLQDVLEAIVGDLPASPATQPGMVQRADGSWLLDGSMPVDEVHDALSLPPLPDARGYHTLAGFLLDVLGHIPATGDRIVVGDWSFEVVDMDGYRIDKVLAISGTPIAAHADRLEDGGPE